MYLSFSKSLLLMFLSLTDEWHPPSESAWSGFLLTTVQRFCSMLFTGHSPGAAVNRCLYPSTSGFKTEDPLPNFLWWKGTIFGAKESGQSFGSFLLLHLNRSCYSMTYIPFSVHPVTGHGVQEAVGFHSDLDSLYILECE